MSPRAACRLDTLGFEHVYDYMPGKVDWLARNLPVEGTAADAPTIAATCGTTSSPPPPTSPSPRSAPGF
jgi:hypothetical protein